MGKPETKRTSVKAADAVVDPGEVNWVASHPIPSWAFIISSSSSSSILKCLFQTMLTAGLKYLHFLFTLILLLSSLFQNKSH